MRRLRLIVLSFVIVLLLESSAPPPIALLNASGIIPAPTGLAAPTISVNPNHGYADQNITVSGLGVSPQPGVRLAWLTGDSTQTTAVVNVNQANMYTTTLTVPADAITGTAKVCATATGSAQVEFGCANFTIDPLPGGSVSGQLPGVSAQGNRPQSLNAIFALLDNSGATEASTAINSDGSFRMDGVPPGVYWPSIIGTVPALYDSPIITIKPASHVDQPIKLFTDCGGAKVESINANPASVSSIHSMSGGSDLQEFGTYVSGVILNVTFNAILQSVSATTVYSVSFEIKKPDGTRFNIGNDVSAPYQTTYNVGLLPEGTSTLYAKVYTEFGSCTKRSLIYVIADPMKDPNIQQPGGVTTWNAGAKRYDFHGMTPNVGDVLPLIYTTPSLPLVGELENKLSAGLYFQGDLELNGLTHITIMNATALARLMNINLYDKTQSLLGGTMITFDRTNPTGASMPIGERSLFSFSKDVPVFSGPIASFWGIVTVKASVTVGIGGDLTIRGTLYPLRPAAEVILTPSVSPRLTVSVWADLLLGIASAGADATASAKLTLPLHINTDSDPKVKFDQICLKFNVVLSAWARVNLLFKKKTWNIGSYKLVNYNPCSLALSSSRSAQSVAATEIAAVSPPSVMASPAIATSPNGQTIAVYVVNTSNVETPTMRIAANFWDAQNDVWGNTMYLSDGTHAVQDPTVTWTTVPETPFVAWTETMLTAAQENVITSTTDINAYLRRQEIFTSHWITQTTWTTPQRLTNDLAGDGRASITDYYYSGGGGFQYVFLAWTKDLDGNVFTRTDSRIATALWDATDGWFDAGLLSAPTLSSMTSNSQVSASGNALAWTVDYDGNIDTNADRHIAVAVFPLGSGQFNTQHPAGLIPDRLSEANQIAAPDLQQSWAIDVPPNLPAGAESPNIRIDPQTGTRQLTFILREKDGDGLTDTGLGNRGALWTAYFDSLGGLGWIPAPMLENEEPIYAETPKLNIDPQGRSYLLFRRFGEAGTQDELGQLALSVGTFNSGTFADPMDVTGFDLRQHWQPAFAIDPTTQMIEFLDVSRAAVATAQDVALLKSRLRPSDRSSQLKFQPKALTADDDYVEGFQLPMGADPAIDNVELSQSHATLNSQVWVTTTVRNLGPNPVYNVVVKVYSVGNLLTLPGTYTVTGPLNFNESEIFSIPVTKTDVAQTVVAQIESSSEDTSPYNDSLSVDMQTLPTPTFVSAAESTLINNAIDVSWLPSTADGVAGYRILRSQTPNGTYELVGETISANYTDRLLQRGQSYCYIVQAYDANGLLSADTEAACGSVSYLKVFLPIVLKAH